MELFGFCARIQHVPVFVPLCFRLLNGARAETDTAQDVTVELFGFPFTTHLALQDETRRLFCLARLVTHPTPQNLMLFVTSAAMSVTEHVTRVLQADGGAAGGGARRVVWSRDVRGGGGKDAVSAAAQGILQLRAGLPDQVRALKTLLEIVQNLSSEEKFCSRFVRFVASAAAAHCVCENRSRQQQFPLAHKKLR